MGFFTWRATKKTRREVQALRRDEKGREVRAAAVAQSTREADLFQQLPEEGKAEFRAVEAAYDARTATWNNRKKYGGSRDARTAREELANGKQAVFRKYDLIP